MAADAEIKCPECRRTFEVRRLRTVTVAKITEHCPGCNGVVRVAEREHSHRPVDQSVEDALAIDGWLAAESLGFEVHHTHERSQHAWRLTGGRMERPDGWAISVHYETDTPLLVRVQVVTTEPGRLSVDQVGQLDAVCREHAFHLFSAPKRVVEFGPGNRPAEETHEWGPYLVLITGRLGPGLLRPALTKLFAALADALATRRTSTR